jgi:hypothetical protein
MYKKINNLTCLVLHPSIHLPSICHLRSLNDKLLSGAHCPPWQAHLAGPPTILSYILCKVKPKCLGILPPASPQIRDLGQCPEKVQPHILECHLAMGFTHCTTRDKHYHEL